MRGVDELRGLQHSVANLRGRLDARVDRIRDADEDPPIAGGVLAQNPENTRPILLAGELNEEVVDLELEECRQQIRVVHVGAMCRILIASRTGVDANGTTLRGSEECEDP